MTNEEKYTQALEVANKRFEEIQELKEKYKDLLEVHKIENNDIQELQKRIDKALEIVDNINKQYEKISDKDLLTNNVVHISVIQEIENILKGEE